MTSGEGKPREVDTRTTVFKRVVDKQYSLRIKGSRVFFNEVSAEIAARMSIVLLIILFLCSVIIR